MRGAFYVTFGGICLYKLIAIDLDGTLLDDKKDIPRDNLETINLLIEKGYEIVVATGRRYWSAKELTKKINGHITIIANNGNIVRNSLNDELLISKYMDTEDYKIIIEEGMRRNLHPVIHIDAYNEGIDLIIERGREYGEYVMREGRFKEVKSFLEIGNEKILTIVYGDSKKALYPFYEFISKNYSDNFNIHIMENLDLVESMIEIMNPDGNKWKTILEYASGMDISPEEIITIGDNNNDISMIKNSGLGIAMKNGSDMVKSVAKIITKKDNNESGVAFELKRVLSI